MKSQRSSSYPAHTLFYSLEFCEKIYKNYGANYRATREELGDALKASPHTLVLKISAAVQYGLLDMKSKEGYKVSDLFVKYFRPIDESQKKEALLTGFKSPTLYESLINTFDGQILPPEKPLANILLQKHNISEVACEKAAQIFLENAKNLGLLNDENMFSVNSKINLEPEIAEVDDFIIEETEISAIPISKDAGTLNSNIRNAESVDRDRDDKNGFTNSSGVVINILLKDRRTAQLGLPNDATSSDLDTIINWIRLMKESF